MQKSLSLFGGGGGWWLWEGRNLREDLFFPRQEKASLSLSLSLFWKIVLAACQY